MTSTVRFVALLAGLIAILGGIGGMLRLLWLISWRIGRMVERFDAHVVSDEKIHEDIERRMRTQELRRR